MGTAELRLPPLPLDPRRPRPLLPLDPDDWPASPDGGSQSTLKPISRGRSLSDRLSVHTPASGDESCAHAAAGRSAATPSATTTNAESFFMNVTFTVARRHVPEIVTCP